VDLGPLNSRNSSSPSTLPAPPTSSSSSSSTSPSLPVTTSFSPAGVLKSRQSMQRGVNLNETSRVKFVCVIKNFRANQISNLEQEKDYDINEKDILVFDGHKVSDSYIWYLFHRFFFKFFKRPLYILLLLLVIACLPVVTITAGFVSLCTVMI
jgi:hypothetical protein